MKCEHQIACLAAQKPDTPLDASRLPDSITLLKWGTNETAQGPFIVNARTAACLAAQLSGGIRDRVILDFEHSSEKFHPNYQPPPRKHAAAGRPACSPELGLALQALSWTPGGREFALEYPDLSAAVDFDPATREVIGLRSAALCKQGAAVHGAAFFSADEALTNPNGVTHMEELLKAAQAAIDALTKRIDALETKLGQAETSTAAAMSAADDIKARFAALSAEGLKARKAAMVDQARREGKVLPLNETAIAALSEEDLAATIAACKPGKVPLAQQTGKPAAAALDADAVMAQYNAIKDPAERSRFFNEHRADMGL